MKVRKCANYVISVFLDDLLVYGECDKWANWWNQMVLMDSAEWETVDDVVGWLVGLAKRVDGMEIECSEETEYIPWWILQSGEEETEAWKYVAWVLETELKS